MGMVFAEITLTNPMDKGFAREGYIKAVDIRAVTVTAVVDTGAMNLFITEELHKKLGLAVKGEKIVVTANGQRVRCFVTEAVEIKWKDRDFDVPAMVIPGGEKVLLGAIPLEGLDLMVNPVSQELIGIHGDEVVYSV